MHLASAVRSRGKEGTASRNSLRPSSTLVVLRHNGISQLNSEQQTTSPRQTHTHCWPYRLASSNLLVYRGAGSYFLRLLGELVERCHDLASAFARLHGRGHLVQRWTKDVIVLCIFNARILVSPGDCASSCVLRVAVVVDNMKGPAISYRLWITYPLGYYQLRDTPS